MEKSEVKTPTKQRVLYFSVLNVLACFGVVLLHCNGEAFWNFTQSRTWLSANLIEALFYFPVPIFFMLSGATLLGYRKRYSTQTFLHKRFTKTLIPFLFWSVVAMLYIACTSEGFDWHPLCVVSNILNTRYMTIYWFFISLFAVYLSIPVLSAVEDNLKLNIYKYAIILGIVFVAILPLICNICGVDYNDALAPPVVAGYMIFILLGYNLSKIKLTKRQRKLIYLCGMLGAAMHFVGCWILSYRYGEISVTFKGYTNLPSVSYAIAIFVWFKHLNYDKILRKLPWLENAINQLAGLTFGVYLIHGFLVYSLPTVLGFDARNWIWRSLGAVVIFTGCSGLVLALKKIPLINRVVP